MKSLRPAILAIVLLVVFGGGYLIQRAKSRERSVLSGTFESQPALLSSRVAGRVKSLIAKEGDVVKPGQDLAVLDAQPDVLDTKALEAAVGEAEQAYKEASLTQSEQIAEQAAVVQELSAALAKEREGSRPEEIQAGRAALANAESKYAEAVHGSRPQEITEAKAAYQAAQATLEKIRRGGSPAARAKAQADLDSARATEAETKLAATRREWLYEEGAISAEARDDANADYEVAVDKRKAAQQTLADLNSRPEDIAFAVGQAAQAQQQFRLLQSGTRKEEIDAARGTRDQASANLKLLVEGNRPEDIEQAKAKLAEAVETLNALKDGSRNNTVAQARIKVEQAKYDARSARSKTVERTIRAPKAAVIERSLVAEGDLLSPGSPVFRVSYPADMYLRIYVPEQSLAHVHAGDRATVSVDGVPSPVECLVESVSTQGEFTPANLQTPEERGNQVFTVRLRPVRINSQLKSGMSATVRQIGDWTP
jgi:HlyD family secretion protein